MKGFVTSRMSRSEDLQCNQQIFSLSFSKVSNPVQLWMEDIFPLLDANSPNSEVSSTGEDIEEGGRPEWKPFDRARAHRARWTILFRIANYILPWTFTMVLSLYVIMNRTWRNTRFQQIKLFPSQMTYSPAQSEIEYVVQSFDHNLVNSPLDFQDPATVDDAWASLYAGVFSFTLRGYMGLLISYGRSRGSNCTLPK